jgi:hypothetical protein
MFLDLCLNRACVIRLVHDTHGHTSDRPVDLHRRHPLLNCGSRRRFGLFGGDGFIRSGSGSHETDRTDPEHHRCDRRNDKVPARGIFFVENVLAVRARLYSRSVCRGVANSAGRSLQSDCWSRAVVQRRQNFL